MYKRTRVRCAVGYMRESLCDYIVNDCGVKTYASNVDVTKHLSYPILSHPHGPAAPICTYNRMVGSLANWRTRVSTFSKADMRDTHRARLSMPTRFGSNVKGIPIPGIFEYNMYFKSSEFTYEDYDLSIPS